MRRWLAILFTALALAIAANVAVAFYCARATEFDAKSDVLLMLSITADSPRYVLVRRNANASVAEAFALGDVHEFFKAMKQPIGVFPAGMLSETEYSALEFGWPNAFRHADEDWPLTKSLRIETYGWPWPSMSRRTVRDFAADFAQHVPGARIEGYEFPLTKVLYWQQFARDVPQREGWPWRPLWPGFALNMLVYLPAVLLAMGFVAALVWHFRLQSAKSRIRLAVAYSAFGVICTAAVAWCSAVWVDPAGLSVWPQVGHTALEMKRWDVVVLSRPTATRVISSTGSSVFSGPSMQTLLSANAVLPWWLTSFRPNVVRDDVFIERTIFEAHGWPLAALRWKHESTALDFSSYTQGQLSCGIALPPREVSRTNPQRWYMYSPLYDWVPDRALPLGPIWLGFIANMITYAAGAWLMTAMIAFVFTRRGHARRRRGLCVRCGYDLRGLSETGTRTCPECGTPSR